MATRAFVLIETAVGKSKEVALSLKKIEGIKSVDLVTGPYDVIVMLEGKDLTEVGDLVTRHIHPVGGIIRTVTCLTIQLS